MHPSTPLPINSASLVAGIDGSEESRDWGNPTGQGVTPEVTELAARPFAGWARRLGMFVTALITIPSAGYAISALVHGLIFVGLAIVFVPEVVTGGSGGIETLVSLGESDLAPGEGLDQLDSETSFEVEGGQKLSTAVESDLDRGGVGFEEPIETLESAAKINPFANWGEGEGQGQGEQVGDGTPGGTGGYAMPGSGKVVTKGSFTAWTIPEDPQPKENYLIVIQVKLPPKYKSMPLNDVTGEVIGTDGYRLGINAYTSKYLHKTKQVVLRIPGAESTIRDTIRVRSQILKESQELTIEF